jgi:hypothetical protein
VLVKTAPGCTFTASTTATWLTLQTDAAGVRVTATSNTTGQRRTATVSVAGQTLAVTQAIPCSTPLRLPNLSIGQPGGLFYVPVENDGCELNAISAPDWIQIAPSGNTLILLIAGNDGANPRTGLVTLNGYTFSVLQRGRLGLPTYRDLSGDNIFTQAIGTLTLAGIVDLCNVPNNTYCPEIPITRAQVATFLGRTLFGTGTFPYPQDPYFSDAGASNPAFRYVQKLRESGVTVGCATARFCPDDPLTRGQMAALLTRAILGTEVFPFPATPFFQDVVATNPFFGNIQKIRQLGVTEGCTVTTYCPSEFVTRGQTAVFLIRAFAR